MCWVRGPRSAAGTSSFRNFRRIVRLGQASSFTRWVDIGVLLMEHLFDAVSVLVNGRGAYAEFLGHVLGRTPLDEGLIKRLPGGLVQARLNAREHVGRGGVYLALDGAAQLVGSLGARETAQALQEGGAANAAALGLALLPPPHVVQGVVDDGFQPTAQPTLRGVVLGYLPKQLEPDFLRQVLGTGEWQSATPAPCQNHVVVARVQRAPRLRTRIVRQQRTEQG